MSTYADIIDEDEIRGEDKVYSFDGIDQRPVVDSSTEVSASHPGRGGTISYTQVSD